MARAAKSPIAATKTAVDALEPRAVIPGKPQGLFTFDAYFAAPKGFHVRVYPSGGKVFFLRYRDSAGGSPPRYRCLRLGMYGEITIGQALERASDARKRLAAGEAPHQDKAESAKLPTVAQVITDYVADLRRTKKESHADETERLLLKNLSDAMRKELITALNVCRMLNDHSAS